MLKKFKLIFLIFLMSSSLYSKNIQVNDMSDNSLILLNEIVRIGKTEKWNSSYYLEGSLKVHVLKDGTITDRGMYVLSKDKFGYPSVVKVFNLNSKDKKFKFIFSPTAQPLFKSGIFIDLNSLKENHIFFKNKEIVNSESTLYFSPFSPDEIYKYSFESNFDRKIKYDFYSTQSELNHDFMFIRLVITFE